MDKGVKIKASSENKKLTLKEFVWNAFNSIFGITFLNYFATVITGTDGGQPLGLHVIWIFLIASTFAYICIFAYKKLSSRFDGDKNGGAMIYAYGTKGKLFGCFVGYSQLLIIPLTVSVQMNMIIKNIFSPDIVSDSTKIPFNVQDWGAFTNLYLDLIGMAIFTGVMLLNIMGIKFFKKFSKWSGIVKWAAGGTFIMLGFVLMFMKAGTNLPSWADKSHVDLYNFTQAFNVSFFTLAGFESILTSGKNVENAKKNLGKGINISMLISIGASLIFLFIMFCAFGNFSENQDINGWTSVFGQNVYAKIGISFSILGIIIMYTNAAIQNGLYAGTSLQPLSEVGFFSKKASYLNKDNIPVRAIVNMVCICIAVAVILLVIPEIIEGINLMPKMNGNRVHDIMEIHDYKAPFSVASLSQVTAVFAIITYASVIFSVLWCIFKQKSIKSNLFLNIAFIVCGIGLVFLIFSHYFFEVYDCINDKNDKSFLIKLVAEVIVLVGSYGFFAINYSIKRKSILNTY